MCGQHQAGEGAAQPDLGEEAQEGDAQHDVRDHSGDMKSASSPRDRRTGGARCERRRTEIATATADDSAPSHRLRQKAEMNSIAADGVEPAQRPAVGRERDSLRA
jgi:hypothetical protein